MKRTLLLLNILLLLFYALPTEAQTQTVVNGSPTTTINFPDGGCVYYWTNNTLGIGLAASGTGNIASFTAVNTGSVPVTATITATPAPAGFAYIANYNDGTVSVINIATNLVVTTIPVGSEPSPVSVSPDGSKVYVGNYASGNVSVIDTKTNTVIATIDGISKSGGVAVSPDGSKVYVTNENPGMVPLPGTVSVINTSTNTLSTTIAVGADPVGVTFSPDGNMAYVVNTNSNNVSVINTNSNTVVAVIPVGHSPIDAAASPDGKFVYISNSFQGAVGTVSVINTATNMIVANIIVGSNPYGLTLSSDGTKLYVSNNSSNSISVINTATNTIIATITPPAFSSLTGISTSSDGNWLYAVDRIFNRVFVINTITNSIVNTVPVGTSPISLGNFVTAGISCGGQPITFTITVNPTPAIPPTITASTVTGNISACVGSPSISPNIQQFTVSGSNLTANATATAPAGFEVSLSPGSGYGNSVTLAQIGGILNSIVVYVHSAASATPGNISGNVTLTSTGTASQSVGVTGIVNALPTVNAVNPQTVVNGTATAAINFTGTANTFTWVNNTPGIGLSASGTGNIAPFTAVNTGSTPVTATITATPAKAGFAYIGNNADGTVSVINVATDVVVATISVGQAPIGVSVSPDGSRAYVTNNSSPDVVSVINTATNSVIASIGVGSYPSGIVVSPDGSRVYTGNTLSSDVSVISTVTNTVVATIKGLSGPIGVSISPDGSRLYVANGYSNTVSVINTATNAIISTILVNSAFGLVVSLNGKTLYVTSYNSNSIAVINTVTNTVSGNIQVGVAPAGLSLSADGSMLYVTNFTSNNVSVINTLTQAVAATIDVGIQPTGISFTADGTRVYVTNNGSNNVSVISTTTNKVIKTITVGNGADSYGNFITAGTGCPGTPITFTITVNPSQTLPPAITANPVTGNISACTGSASISPKIQQFTVSGSNLTSNITAIAPQGFEISLDPVNGYGNNVTISQSSGSVSSTIIYVRSAASDPAGNISGNVVLTSQGATDQTIVVTGVVNGLPVVNTVGGQVVLNGSITASVNFTGTANIFNWANDTPGIGLAASGNGNINSFTAINTGSTPITATITATPSTSGGTGCTGIPITFTITVNPTPTSPPTIITGTATGNISACVGEPSAGPDIQQITVNGVNLTSDVTVTAPVGFEVSLSTGSGYGSNITVAQTGGTIGNVIYVRSAADPAGNISGNVTLTSTGAISQNVAVSGIINALPIVNTVANQSVVNGGSTTTIHFTGTGNIFSWTNDTPSIGLAASGIGNIASFTVLNTGNNPVIATIAVTPLSSQGQACNGIPVTFTITVNPVNVVLPAISIPNTFTPNGDGINDVWTITALANYPQCTVAVFTRYGGLVYQSRGYPTPWDGTYNGAKLPDGTYYYIIKPQIGVAPLAGYVTIIR